LPPSPRLRIRGFALIKRADQRPYVNCVPSQFDSGEGSGPNVCLSGSSGWPLRDHAGIAAFQSVQIVGTSGDSLVCLDCGYTELVIPATKLEQLKKVWNQIHK
jgi:hypothetical protein